MRLFNFDDPQHQEANQLLPWYVNGTLSEIERARVDAHVSECVACRRELVAQLQLRDAVRTESLPPAMERGLERLHAQLEAERAAHREVAHREVVHREVARPAPQTWWQRQGGLALLVGAQTIVIFVLLAMLWPDPEPSFRTLSAPPTATVSRDAVVVVFDPATTQQQVQALLRELDARIVDGPNRRGAYTIDVPEHTQAQALERLRGVPTVRFAQPAPGSAGMTP